MILSPSYQRNKKKKKGARERSSGSTATLTGQRLDMGIKSIWWIYARFQLTAAWNWCPIVQCFSVYSVLNKYIRPAPDVRVKPLLMEMIRIIRAWKEFQLQWWLLMCLRITNLFGATLHSAVNRSSPPVRNSLIFYLPDDRVWWFMTSRYMQVRMPSQRDTFHVVRWKSKTKNPFIVFHLTSIRKLLWFSAKDDTKPVIAEQRYLCIHAEITRILTITEHTVIYNLVFARNGW